MDIEPNLFLAMLANILGPALLGLYNDSEIVKELAIIIEEPTLEYENIPEEHSILLSELYDKVSSLN